jgi:hypothetical protein
MQIGMSGDDLTFSVPVTCTVGTRTVQASPYVAGDGVKLISPVLFAQDTLLTGSIGPTQETPVLKRTGSWQLIALPNGY